MSIDFSKIEHRDVGYSCRFDYILETESAANAGPLRQKKITFGEFISSYLPRAESVEQVYQRLRLDLDTLENLADSLSETNEVILPEDVAKSALQREAIRKSMDLIWKHYLSLISY